MAVDSMGYRRMDDQIAVREAAAVGLRTLERLVFQLSHQQSPSDCREVTDNTIAKFKKVISVLNRTGHARFRRGPAQPAFVPPVEEDPASVPAALYHRAPAPLAPAPVPPQPPAVPRAVTLDFTKPKESFSASGTVSSSSLTGDGSVTGKQGSSIFVPAAAAFAVSAGKPPLASSHKRKAPEHAHPHCPEDAKQTAPAGRCHCSKKRKNRDKRTVRVPAISSRNADIPADDHSWRKYGQKPIKGSPYPRLRGYVEGGSEGGDPRVGAEEAEERSAAGAGEEAGAREPGANLHPRQQYAK